MWVYVHKFCILWPVLFVFPWKHGHDTAIPSPVKKKKPVKPRVHISIAEPILEGLEALAALQKRPLSDLLEELGRDALKELGIVKPVTASEIEAEIERRRDEKK